MKRVYLNFLGGIFLKNLNYFLLLLFICNKIFNLLTERAGSVEYLTKWIS